MNDSIFSNRTPKHSLTLRALLKIRDMKRATPVFCLCLLAGILTTPANAQKYSNEFLSIGVGARAQALGNAVIASVADVSAGVWNPAGLADANAPDGLQLGAMHAEWFAGVGKFDYLGASFPLTRKDSRLAVSLIRFGIDEIPNTLSLYESDGTINFDNIREFSAADYALFLSYARRLTKPKGEWLLGGNLKVVYRRIGPFANSWGFGLDLGAQYHRERWRFGVLAKDVTTTFNAWSFQFTEEEKQTLELTNNDIPINSVEITKPMLVLGIARTFPLSKTIGLLPELNAQITTDGKRNTLLSSDPFSLDLGFGLEADFRQTVFLRVGINQFQNETDFDGKQILSPRPSLGTGLKLGGLQVDYAFTDLASDNNTYSHIVSLLLHLKPKTSTGK
jgi:hypothetical protein